LLKVIDDLLKQFPKFLVNLHWIVTANSGDQIGASANVDLIVVVPLHPSMILEEFSNGE